MFQYIVRTFAIEAMRLLSLFIKALERAAWEIIEGVTGEATARRRDSGESWN